MTGARARAVADAVLYEGYLLYPYRASSGKNQSRWQFGVLGPPGAADSGLGEDATISAQCLVEGGPEPTVTLTVRFLQLQHRGVQDSLGNPVAELIADAESWISWDEAVECEQVVGPLPLHGALVPLDIPGGSDIETIEGAGRLVRTREPVVAELELTADREGDLTRLTIAVRNTGAAATDKHDAIARSCIGAHVIAEVHGGAFVSLLEPPDDAALAAANCRQHRCFPVLAGPPGDSDVLLISPIILYDHPEIAEQSEGALFDSTEIDEILTLRVMTMTDEEKAQARATDPLAAQLIDRCDAMTPESMQRLHGVLRDPHLGEEQPRLVPEIPDGVDWWDPFADNAVAPDTDAVLVAGVRVAKGSHVRLHPSRRADAQDLFFDGKLARVTAVHEDVDGQAHVAVVIDDDPAADLHEWYGRYLYFAPDEVEPVSSPQK
ncbi:hypothetical protein [Aldersonia kunmingensis]|uniref:hypothetical protein n=1 Tax=Aldersonia kunmingensis TaxID=408066 RepID=UPI00082FE1A3|nr:hypothetical protein [Aldersonia kunmingensis]